MITYGIRVDFIVETYKGFVNFHDSRTYYFANAGARDAMVEQLEPLVAAKGWTIARVALINPLTTPAEIIGDIEAVVATNQIATLDRPAIGAGIASRVIAG